ncbi:CDP-glycerol glycerophosphotransferase family protein [Psychromonas sp. SR45-3]|uniref:CDP-glycerol glycerophosphotransferase family protein n=1 Tax=Psychromonas sp. SR45-3 TaxID=2760930 RepID=UPI0015FA85CC|nr:CDP-glycerol glycerophosphotransferase family protein [Psychromonas sp. SR45-3]MBB1274709.1 CDP-glycerol glycerophosphotransferase family protein [Psychromonas sp. SR45-3]
MKLISKLSKYIFSIVNTCIPKKKKRVLFKSIPDYSGNAKAFSDYLVKHYPEYEIVWLITGEPESSLDYQSRKSSTLIALYYYVTSKYILTTHNEMVSTIGLNQKYISLWHGMPLKKVGYLGESEYLQMADYSANRIATSEVTRSIISAAFREKANKVLITGQPKNDYLFDDEKCLSKLGINENYDTLVFFAPTFRANVVNRNNGSEGGADGGAINENNFLRVDDFDVEALNNFLKSKNILLLIKLHPFEEDTFMGRELGTNIRVLNSPTLKFKKIDINHILSKVDILITDYSSVYFDFLVLDRPIVFLVPDLLEYGSSRGGYTLEPFDFWTPGRKVYSQHSLTEEVNTLISGDDEFSNQRRDTNSIINRYSDNKNCERVFNTFFEKKQY